MTDLANNSIKAKLLEAQKERIRRMSRALNDETESPNKKLKNKFNGHKQLEEHKTHDRCKNDSYHLEHPKDKVNIRKRLFKKASLCSPAKLFDPAAFIK
jgi:hypothetical protein